MGETLFSLGEVYCDLCWCLCNVDHREKAKEKVSGCDCRIMIISVKPVFTSTVAFLFPLHTYK